MKMIQRIIRGYLVVCMLLSLLPAQVFGAEMDEVSELSISGTCGNDVVWTYDELTKRLTISGTGEMTGTWFPYDLEDEPATFAPWHDFADQIESVVIEYGVTSVGHFSFYGCSNLCEISIPESVTMVGCAFVGSGLEEIYIPASVTDFRYPSNEGVCEGLTKIIVDPDNSVYSSDASGMLYNKSKTKFIGCPTGYRGDVSIADSVTEIGDFAFVSCEGVTNVSIPDSTVKLGMYAFIGCSNLEKIEFPTNMSIIGPAAFSDCSKLTSLRIPASITRIEQMAFSRCTSLQEIWFEGDAPFLEYDFLYGVAVTAYYPAGNHTWTAQVFDDYGGTVQWMPYSEVPGVLTESYLIEQISKGVMEIQLTEDLIVENTLVLPANVDLTVSEGCTITIKQKTTIAGVLTIDNGAKLIVDGELRCVNGGTINVAGEYEFVSDSEEERYVVRDCQEGKNVTINGIDTKDQKLIAKFDYYIEEEIGNYYTNQELTDILNNDNYGAYDIIVGEAEENGWQYETLVIPETCHLTVYLWAKNCTDEWTIPERSTVINKGHITIQSTSGIMVSGTFVNQGSVDCNGLIALHGGTFVNEGKVNIHPGGGVKESGGTWQGSEPVRVCENPCENEQYLIKQYSDGTYSYWLDTDIVLENDFTVTKELHIYDFYTVTIPAGKTLIVDGFLINCRGTIVVESGGTLVVNGYLAFRELGKLTVKSGGNLVINDYLECSGASVLNVEGNYEIGTKDGKKCYVELQKSWEWYYSGNEINGIASEDIFLDTTVSNANDLRELLETTSYGKANINLQVYDKDFVLDCDITIPKNYELVDWWGMIISDNCTVTNNGILRIDGSLKNDGVIKLNEDSGFINTEGEITNNSIIYVYDGSEFFSDYTFQNNGTVYAYEGCKLKVSEDYWEGNAPIEVETSGWCGDKLKWMFDAPVGTLTISGSGNMWNFTISLKQKSANPMVPWAFCQSEIKKVVLSEGVTSVGNNAFAGCTQLTEVTLPKSITAIGEAAFQNSGLKEITFQGDAPEVSESAFQGVSATVLYPQDNETWTDDKKQDFGGNLTWDEPEDDHDGKLGDVNHDTKINAKDATLILQKSVGVLKETAKFCETCAEVSGDGKLNAKDSTLILQFSVGLREIFPAEQ